MKKLSAIIVLVGSASIASAQDVVPPTVKPPLKRVPFSLLNPPPGISPAQFEQLKAVRDAVKDIPASVGSGIH